MALLLLLSAVACGDDPMQVEPVSCPVATECLDLFRPAWHWSSIPSGFTQRGDSLNRVPVAFYNPFGEVKRGDLNPELPENVADDGVIVLELGFHRQRVRDLLQADPAQSRELWSGVMTAFPGNGLDLSETRTIEFWLNDGVGDAGLRRGTLHLDFGDVSEDFVLFPNNPNRPGGALEPSTFNREADSEDEFLPQSDDWGWNGRPDDCDNIADRYDQQWPAEDCYIPSTLNQDRQHSWAVGTQGNNQYDIEDINGNGNFDITSSYFRFSMELADTTWVAIDINPTYGPDPRYAGWRRYRIDFDRIRDQLGVIQDPGESPPSLGQIRYLRRWFEDPAPPAEVEQQLWVRDIQLYDFKFVGLGQDAPASSM